MNAYDGNSKKNINCFPEYRRVAVRFGDDLFFELSHLSYDTEEILKANQRNVELAEEMLGAVHDQNVAVVHLAILQDASYDSLCRMGMQRLEHAVATARKGRWTARHSIP